MAQLPSDLVKEILCRLPPKSLARLRTLSKQWNAIWEEKGFLNMYFAQARPQFILWTKSKICSVDINLNVDDHVSPIEVREIALDDITCRIHNNIVHCDGFLLSDMCEKGFAVWNPWLRQTRCIVPEETHRFRFCGVGYDNTKPFTGYKIFGYSISFDATRQLCPKLAIYDCKSDAWKFINAPCGHWRVPPFENIVSLKGSLYWISYNSKTREHVIRSFDFSTEMFKTFCLLPCNEDFIYTQILAVFMVDRFSVLRQSYMTREVDILVTKNKINGNGEAVAWMSFMTVSIPKFPKLQQKCLGSQPSYFVDNNKKLIVCTCDQIGQACIYIVKGDVFRKILIDSMVDPWPSHLTYIPSFVPIRILQREEQKLQD